LKAYLITPVDIKYSYRGTEYHVYEYAKFLNENGIDANVLITEELGRENTRPVIKNYDSVRRRYSKVGKKEIEMAGVATIHGQPLYTYLNLPKDGPIYFPYNLHYYLVNIALKPMGQSYIIGSHGLQFKLGKLILGGHQNLENFVNFATRASIFSKLEGAKNVYFHVLNKKQARYLTKLGVKSGNIFYIPAMVDTKNFKMGSNNSKALKVVHVGGTEKESGIVLEVIKQLNRIGKLGMFEFYFIGNPKPEEAKELELISKKYDNIHLLGRVSDSVLVSTLSKMDVMMVTAYEIFPKTMLEGVASGLYMVTSNRNDAAEDFQELGVKLDIVKTGVPSEYVQPLVRLANKKSQGPAKFNPYKKRNRGIVLKKFDQKVLLSKVLKMFLKVMNTDK